HEENPFSFLAKIYSSKERKTSDQKIKKSNKQWKKSRIERERERERERICKKRWGLEAYTRRLI
ncbi:hypothetical protein ACMBCM_07800, partial [Spiroplasma sp. K1]